MGWDATGGDGWGWDGEVVHGLSRIQVKHLFGVAFRRNQLGCAITGIFPVPSGNGIIMISASIAVTSGLQSAFSSLATEQHE